MTIGRISSLSGLVIVFLSLSVLANSPCNRAVSRLAGTYISIIQPKNLAGMATMAPGESQSYEDSVKTLHQVASSGKETTLDTGNGKKYHIYKLLGEGGSAYIYEASLLDGQGKIASEKIALRVPKILLMGGVAELFITANISLREQGLPTVELRHELSNGFFLAVEQVEVLYDVASVIKQFSTIEEAKADKNFGPIIRELEALLERLAPYSFQQSDLHMSNIVRVKSAKALGGREGWLILDSSDRAVPFAQDPDGGWALNTIGSHVDPNKSWYTWAKKIAEKQRGALPDDFE